MKISRFQNFKQYVLEFNDIKENSKKYTATPKDKESGLPKKYVSGLSTTTAKARKAHWDKTSKMRDDDPNAYEPAPGDATAKTKPSKHTMAVRKMMNENKDASLVKKAKKFKIPIGILRQVYKRGVAAWNSGHRPGTTPEQWGHARVNSYINKGKTYYTTDKDLRENKTTKISKFQNFKQLLESNHFNYDAFEQDILDNWNTYYDASHGNEIPYGKYGVETIMGEVWTTECVEHLMDEDDEDGSEYVQDEIDRVMVEENWDGYVYIDPYESDEEFGITIYYRKKVL
jgi:hypothetical protein